MKVVGVLAGFGWPVRSQLTPFTAPLAATVNLRRIRYVIKHNRE
jgi:hypothetical protein